MEKKHLFIGIGSLLGVVSATFISLFVWKSVTSGNTPAPEPQVVEHFVTFESDGGTHVDPQRVEDGKTVTKPTDPKKEIGGFEYHFDGWYNGEQLFVFDTPVTQDITLTAKWSGEIQTGYVVTFENYGGNPHIDSQLVKPNGKAKDPGNLTRGEDEFLGWFTDFGLPNYDFNTPVTKDITLYAGWKEAPEPETTHHFKFTGTNCLINGQVLFECDIAINGQAQFAVVPVGKYTFPTNITFDKGEGIAEYDNKTGYIKIGKMTSDVEIKASAVPINYYTFSFTSETCTIDGKHEYTKDGIQKGTTTTFTILPDAGHVLPETIDTPEGVTYKDGVITITNMSSDVTLSNVVAPIEEIFYSINFNGAKCKAKGGDITTSSYSFQTTRSSKDTDDFVITLSPDAGCTLPSEIEILFDNVPGQTGDYTYDSANKKITIIKKANVLIKVTAVDPTKTYTVTWLDYDGKELKIDNNVEDDTKPVYEDDTHPTPTRESDAFHDYHFAGWLPEPENIHCDTTYVATYDEDHYDAQAYMKANMTEDEKTFKFNYEVLSGAPEITIDWGDGNSSLVSNGSASHEYTKIGKYNIRIVGCVTSVLPNDDSKNFVEKIYLGPTITSLSVGAFSGYSNLTSIEISSNVTSIPDECFSGCSKLVSVSLSNKITSIGANAFYECSALASIEIPTNLTSLSERTFCYCTSLTSIEIPNGVASIPKECFYVCDKLTTVKLPNRFISIGESAFRECSSLISIENSANINSISESAFHHCGFISIDLPNVDSIPNGCFGNCRDLTSINIPNVSSIGIGAFSGCASLTFIELPRATSFGTDVFTSPNITIKFSEITSVPSINNDTFGYETKAAIEFTKVPSIPEECFKLNTHIVSIKLPAATQIASGAFDSCRNLAAIEMSSVESIGNMAFRSCNLSSIKLPNSLTSIGVYSFYDNPLTDVDLTQFTINDTIPTTGMDAFGSDLSNTKFHVISEEMANKFMSSEKGWPTTLESYSWPQ